MAHVFEKKWRSKDVQLQENVDFSVMLLQERVLSGLTKAGYKKPSPIQLEAIPVGRVGKDLLVQAKSGTGKTLVFTIIALEQLKRRLYRPQTLILAPTREIATQIANVIQSVGSSFPKLKCCSFIGGLAFSDDKENALTCQIVVGTPGRVRQLIKSGYMPTTCIRLLVFDEADQLLQGTFKLEIDDIFNTLPKDKQVIATSATYPARLRKTIFQYFREPHLASLNSTELALLGIVHYTKVIRTSLMPLLAYKFKLEILKEILNTLKFSQCLIFCNGISRVEYLCHDVRKWGYTATYISSAKVQLDRLKAMDRLKSFKCKVFISSDVSARGIDAENVDLVINFDIPFATETYLHRVGRAGRYGSVGVSITIMTETEYASMGKIEAQGTFKSYKLPDPLPSNLIQSPSLGEYSFPELASNEVEQQEEEEEASDDKEAKTDGVTSSTNGVPFSYNFIDFNRLSSKKQRYVNDGKEIKQQTIPDVAGSNLSTKVDNSTDIQLNLEKIDNEKDNLNPNGLHSDDDNRAKNDNEKDNLNPNGSHSDDDILVLEKIIDENSVLGIVSDLEKMNKVEIIENCEISSNKNNLIDSSNSTDENCINAKCTVDEKICISGSNTTSNSPQILYNDVEKNKLYEIALDEKESSCEFKNMKNCCDINDAVDSFILNYEKNKDLSPAFQDKTDETANDKNLDLNLVIPNMVEKLKQDRSSYLYKVFKCYQNENKKNCSKEFDESGENFIAENKKESTPLHSNSYQDSLVNKIKETCSGITPMQPAMNKENDAEIPIQNSKPKLGNTIPKFNKLYSSDSESDSDIFTAFSSPENYSESDSDIFTAFSSPENYSERSSDTSSINREKKGVHKRSSHRFHKYCNNGTDFNDCSISTDKSVCCNRSLHCCSKQASSSKYKCVKASRCCYGDSHTARNICQNQDTRNFVPIHNCNQISCCNGSVPNNVTCYMPSKHQCHIPCCSCTYSSSAVCNMWHDTFMNQWFHVQRCINSSVWH